MKTKIANIIYCVPELLRRSMVSITSSSLRQLANNAQKGRRYCSTRTPSRLSFSSVAWLVAFCLLLVASSLLFLDNRSVYNPSYSSLLNLTASAGSFMQNDSVAADKRIRRIVVILSDGSVASPSPATPTTATTRRRNVTPMTILNKEETNEYKDGLPDPLETEECQVQYQWQKDSKPTCNDVHELDMNAFYFVANHASPGEKGQSHGDLEEERLRLVASGGWRDVWAFFPQQFKMHPYILKTLRYDIEVVPRNIDRHRRDALVMERLSSSPNIVDIYSFCGNSGFTDFADGGDIESAIVKMNATWPSPQVKLERLHIGTFCPCLVDEILG
jgi:hypothetical protein